ncbi:MAG: hypothetical protein ACE5F9_01940 [Phycisphaerae bacterium]
MWKGRIQRVAWAVVPCMMVVALLGCRDERRLNASEAAALGTARLAVADDAPPVVVARALIQTLEELKTIRENGLGTPGVREAYDRAMGTVRSLAAGPELFRRWRDNRARSLSISRGADEAAVVAVVARSWASIVGYYADGFLMNTLREVARDKYRNGTMSLVTVDAEPPHAQLTALKSTPHCSIRAGIDVRLLQSAGGPWRVVRVDLGPPRDPATILPVTAQPPTSQAVSAPATTPSQIRSR